MKLNEHIFLLVEDDPNVRLTIKCMLHEMGITQIREAENGHTALRFLEGEAIEISFIICDWNMPHKTGIEFLREVRQVSETIPFLMITARADKDSILAAKSSNVTAYIRKPFTFKELKDKITAVLAMTYNHTP